MKLKEDKATVFLDSQSALHLCKNPAFHERTKHVDVRYHFIREKVIEGKILVEKISTEDNLADVGTKVLTLSKFKLFVDLLGIREI